jgi:E3 ubiquitin-protein ligase HERC2
MGFDRRILEKAVGILCRTGDILPSPESLVGWLLEQNLNSLTSSEEEPENLHQLEQEEDDEGDGSSGEEDRERDDEDYVLHPRIVCDGCQTCPITGPRFKCKVCPNFDFCQNCFYSGKDHAHTFFRMKEPGFPLIYAGKPEKSHGVGRERGILRDWAQCVKTYSVSSFESWSARLLDGNPATYWQSCGTQGKHWILMEMQTGVVVRELKLFVNPADGSYVPSKILISGGLFDYMIIIK